MIGSSNFVPGTGLWDDGHLSVTTPVCTYSQQSFVHSALAKTFVFFKQWGGVRKTKNGRVLEGRTYDGYPSRSSMEVPEKLRCVVLAETFLNTFRELVKQSPLVQLNQSMN
jgi:hypothetical protein